MKDKRSLPPLWKDEYVSSLDDAEFRLFLYIHTNDHLLPFGVMDCNVANIALESCLDDHFVCATLNKFEDDGLIVFDKRMIFVVTFVKEFWGDESMEDLPDAIMANRLEMHGREFRRAMDLVPGFQKCFEVTPKKKLQLQEVPK